MLSKSQFQEGLRIAAVLTAIYYLVVLAGAIAIYKHHQRTKAIALVEKLFPYPAGFVDRQVIPLSRFRREVDARATYASKNKLKVSQKDTEALVSNQLVNRILYSNTLNKYHIVITDSDIDKRLEAIYKEAGGQQKLQKFLQDNYGQDITLADFRIWVKELLSESAIQHQLLTRVQVRHILIAIPENATDEQVATLKKKSADIKSKITDINKFGEAAKQYSDDVASRDKNGDLGTTVRGEIANRFSQEFETALFSLPIGQISDPIRSKYGWHIVIVDKREGLINESLEELTTELRAATKIKTFFGS